MNKQEVFDIVSTLNPDEQDLYEYQSEEELKAFKEGFEWAKSNAMLAVNQLKEPQKPVVPQFVADWYEEHKDDFEHCIYEEPKIIRKKIAFDDLDDFHNWFNFTSNKPVETLVKMKLFGYKVEKKLYTAKLKSTGEYLRYRREFKEIHHFKTTDKDANSYETYHFTKDELRKYNAWENEAYEVTEVEE